MPLPENWDGVFYSAETSGDMIYDLAPKEFVGMVGEIQPDSVEFLIAGAVYDLLANGDHGRAEEYLEVARGEFPEAPWDEIPAIAKAVTDPALGQVDGLGSKVYKVVQVLFNDSVRIVDVTSLFMPDGTN
ncbi:MAG TPA: hypothetical protein VNG32_03685 [Candidatus Dormibacteraeota bacterium]|nr:hypothetical protein [Candidatus Dormibacteraeota bacterium]